MASPSKAGRPLAANPIAAHQPLRVLLAEDNPADAELIVALLKRAGYKLSFDVVDSALRFEERLAQTPYDLVLSDHNLRDWTGVDALAILHKLGKDIPFLIVTSALGDEAAVDYVKSGAADYVLKHRLDRLPVAVGRALRERAHREETARLQEIIFSAKRDWELTFDAVPDLIAILDRDGKLQRANRAVTEVTGLKFTEIIGRPCWEVLHGMSEICEDCPHLRSQENGHMQVGDVQPTRLGKTYETSCTPLFAPDGRVQATVVVMRDVTERRKNELEIRRLNAELEQRVAERTAELAAANRELELRNREVERANQMKSQFLTSMSHELRTPLNAILGFSSLLTEQNAGPLTEKQSRYVQHIQRGGQHLLQLINDILDLSKIEAGRMEMHPEQFPVSGALPEVLSLIRPLAMAKKIPIDSPADAGTFVYADPVRFKQILYNLLSNAVKFTPEGGNIGIETYPEGDCVRLLVRDTGIGIPAGELEDIFNEFHQVGTTTRGVKEGTGLGLAICKRLVHQQGGKIWVESEVGQGSVFHFTLPAGPPAPLAERPALAQAPGRSARKDPLVLIVDDEPQARELLVNYLQPEGYQVATASSGQEALAQAIQLRPDAITLNMLMPGKTGWQALYELKNSPQTAPIPIIIVSVIDKKKMGFALGAAEYLVKPVAKETLLSAIEKHIQPKPGRPGILLVVDDVPRDLHMMAELLQSGGYSILTAGGGREALEILARARPDAILLDLLMPEVDGFEVIRYVKGNELLREIPIFVLTAHELSEMDVEMLGRETRAFFRKGVPWKLELLEQVRQTIGRPQEA